MTCIPQTPLWLASLSQTMRPHRPPVFRSPLPAWLPWEWDLTQFRFVLDRIVGEGGYFGPALVRTVVYVVLASGLCVLIAYPVAYYTARYAGRCKGCSWRC